MSKNGLRLIFAALAAVLFLVASSLATNPIRQDQTAARDSSVIPNNETDLTELTIADDSDHTVDLTESGSLGWYPLILMARADGNFQDGSNAPNQANDLWRDSGQLWSIPVAGRQTWHFKRQTGAGTVHIYLKLLGSN